MFESVLSEEMASFLELRKSIVSARSVTIDKYVLILLDKHLVEHNYGSKNLTEEILNSWRQTLRGKSKTIQLKVIAIRNFVKYLNELGIQSFLPEVPKVKSDYIPHFYTDDELTRIFKVADNLVNQGAESRSYPPVKIPMILRILYGCGTRLEETLELQRRDIDFKTQTILLRKAKGHKERLIPVHETLAQILERYCLAADIMFMPDAYLFQGGKTGAHLTSRQALDLFKNVLRQANVNYGGGTGQNKICCFHDFRHLFVLKSISQMESAGRPINMNDLLLPTYLGHEGMLDTDKYMKFSGVLQPDSIEAFETYTSGLIPNVEAKYAKK